MALPMPSPHFVHALDLPDTAHPPFDASKEGACVAGHSLVSFVSGVSRQNREDVLNSTLLMQLAADKAFSRVGNRQEWLNFYTDGLACLGWKTSDDTLVEYRSSQQSFTLDQVALDIVGSATGGAVLSPIVKKTFDSLQSNSAALSVFDNHSQHAFGGMFEILPCAQTPEGNVAVQLNCMYFKSNSLRTAILFSSYQRYGVEIFHATQTAVLDTQLYSLVRESVLDKLGHNARQFVKQLKL